MSCIRTGLTAALVLGLAQAAAGQEAVDVGKAVDVSKLPVDLGRIERQLRQSMDRETHDGLNLQFFVGVFGQAPPLELFTKDDDLLHGPVPHTAPTHQEFLQMVTPQEYRAPVMNFSNLFRRMTGKGDRKTPE